MNTLFVPEQVKFNKLLRVMRRTLYDVQRALKGLLVMSSDLEDVANCIFTQAVPGVWEAVGYPSLMPLTPWYTDLLRRVKFILQWIEFGTPKAFWISGFFLPTSIFDRHASKFCKKVSETNRYNFF